MNEKYDKKNDQEGYQQMKKADSTNKTKLEDFNVEEYLKTIYKEGSETKEVKESEVSDFFKKHQNLIIKVLIGVCYAVIFGVLLSKFFAI
jgi:hypothetical protein